MGLEKWNRRYREGHDDLPVPLPFFIDYASTLAPGRALDLACGTGRHSIWLAERGWQVTAIDGSAVAIELLRARELPVDARIADIESADFRIPGTGYDLVIDTFFLHRPLFPQIAEAVRPGGAAVFAFHLEGSFAIERQELDVLLPTWERIHFLEHREVPTVETILRRRHIA